MKEPCTLREIEVFQKNGIIYHRWYCSCGAVGGKRLTTHVAQLDFNRHKEESNQS